MDPIEEDTFSTTDGLVTFGAGVALPTFDIYSDVSLVVVLLSIEPLKESDGQLGLIIKPFAIPMGHLMTIPLILNTFFILPHWLKCEKTLIRRISTFPLLLLQLYPQYRSMRIMWWAFVRKNATQALKEKHHLESGLSNVGKFNHSLDPCRYTILTKYFRSVRWEYDSSSLVLLSYWISCYIWWWCKWRFTKYHWSFGWLKVVDLAFIFHITLFINIWNDQIS